MRLQLIILTYTISCTVFKLLQTIVHFLLLTGGSSLEHTHMGWTAELKTMKFGLKTLETFPYRMVWVWKTDKRTERSLRVVDTNSVKARKQYTRTSFNWLTTSCFSRSSWAICDSESVSKTYVRKVTLTLRVHSQFINICQSVQHVRQEKALISTACIGDMCNFTTVSCNIYSRLKWYKMISIG